MTTQEKIESQTKKLEIERDIYPPNTGPYQKYQNAINALKKYIIKKLLA